MNYSKNLRGAGFSLANVSMPPGVRVVAKRRAKAGLGPSFVMENS